MKRGNLNINKLRIRQIVYVFFWSLGLFAATFYCLFEGSGKITFGRMATISAFDLAKTYLFPLFIALALFLLDVRHETSSHGQQFTLVFSKRFISCFLVFAFAIAFSVLFNTVFWGWFFFLLSWLALSALKLFTLMEIEINGTKIDS